LSSASRLAANLTLAPLLLAIAILALAIASCNRKPGPDAAQKSPEENLYPADADAQADIKAAEERAAKAHKRVLLVFGANWCEDCHVLDRLFHSSDFASAVAAYEIVHVDAGPDGKKNRDIALRVQVRLGRGIPALAILESDGRLVVSKGNGELENVRAVGPQAILDFLNKWRLT
jgi:thiol:disulfide interchange protein